MKVASDIESAVVTSEEMKKSRSWIPLASLVAGPVLAFAFWAADVFLLNPDMYADTDHAW